jgi:hypothetical protein
MGAAIGAVIGLVLAAFGFAAMRDPMRFNLNPFSPSAQGYYQRMVLDASTRNQLRLLGALICLFGSSIFTSLLAAALKSHWLDAGSTGLWALMGYIFLGTWGLGLLLFLWQLSRGRSFDWFKAWRLSAQLGPINVSPAMTPKMRREAQLFTAALLTLSCIAALLSLHTPRR